MSLLEFKNLYKYYNVKDSSVYALENVSFNVEKGQFVSFVGDSGAGKSTLMNMVGCLDRPDRGKILYNGKNIFSFDERRLSEYRNRVIGFVFQNFNLSSELTAVENVELPLIYSGLNKKQRLMRAYAALERVGLSDRANHKPGEMSGGQKQRVAIARAIVNNPEIILADEPTGNLDAVCAENIMSLLSEINKNGTTLLMVTHNMAHTDYCGRIIRLKSGQIVKDILIN